MKRDLIIDQAYDEIRSWIAGGKLEPGMRLPSERQLAERLGVSRFSVREALTRLTDEGLLKNRSARIRVVAQQSQAAARGPGLLANTVCVLAQSTSRPAAERQPGWSDRVLLGVLEGIEARNTNVLIIHRALWLESVRRFTADRPLGVLVPETLETKSELRTLLGRIHRAGIPVVVYGDTGFDDLDQVLSDHERGAFALTNWLIARGRKRIAQLWSCSPDLLWRRRRRAGYERAMAEAGLEPLPAIPMPAFPQETWKRDRFNGAARVIAGHLAEHLTAAEPVDALMLASDREVFGVAAACRLFGKKPNDDVLLVGYDNYWEDCEERKLESAGPLATADKCNAVIGEEMVALLMDRIDGKLPDAPQTRVIPPEVMILGDEE